jgi:Acyl-CoA carboxylase epsilon subunit
VTEPEVAPVQPALRVIRGGEPSDEDLAAIVAVLSVRAASAEAIEPQPLRQPLNAWVASGLVKGTRTKV